MADKDFGVKRINLVGAAGTPTITSPTDLIINANKVAISTNATVGGSLGIGTTNPTSKLWVGGDGYFTGVITATKFSGQLDATSAQAQSVGFATTATNLAGGATGSLPYQSSSGITTFLSATSTNNQVLLYDTNSNSPKWGSVSGAVGALTGITVRDEGTNVGTSGSITTLNFVGSNIQATATTGASGIATITISDTLVGKSLSISGISTLGTVKISSGIITSTTGTAVTFYGNFVGTASSAGYAQTAFTLNGVTSGDLNVAYAQTTGIATNLADGVAGNVPYQSAPNSTQFVTNGVTGQVLISNGNAAPSWGNVSAASGSFGGITVRDEGTNVGTSGSITTLNFVGSNIQATATTGASGIATITISDNLVGTALSISGISTFNGVRISSGIITSNIVGTSVTFYGDFVGTASSAGYATTAFNLNGVVESNLNVAYAQTAGISTVATKLQTGRTISLSNDLGGSVTFDGSSDVIISATIQANSVALGSDTTGDYVQSITGTSNQITVSATSGEGSTAVISIPTNPTLPGTTVTIQNDLQVNRNLNVNGNITIGGTTAFLDVQRLQVSDADIILGFRTDAFGNDVSNDTTANHGGIAIASTEGSPLVNLNVAGIETLAPTYKKIMWFKSGAFAGLGTDAWLFNYAVGIGSTQFPAGTRLAAGSVQFTENDLAVVRNINATGVITATKFVGSVGFATTATNLANGATGSLPYQSSPGITTFLSASGSNNQVLLYDTNSNSPKWGSVSGANGAFGGISVQDEGTQVGTGSSIVTLNFVGSNIKATATTGASGIATITIADNLVGTGLSISGISTVAGVQISSGIISSTTGTAVTFIGNLTGTASYATTAGIATHIGGGSAGNVHYQSAPNITAFVTNPGVSGKVLLFNGSVPVWGDVSAASGSFGGISVQDEGTQVGTGSSIVTLNFVGSNIRATATTGASGIATITISDNLVGTALSISGITTVGGVQISSGIITSTTGTAVTYYGDGSKLTGLIAGVSISTNTTNQAQYLTYVTGTGSTAGFGITTTGLVFNPSRGNLGIGTINPTSKLSVQGDVFVSGFSTFKNGLEVTDLLVLKPGQQSSNLFEILNDAQDVVVAVTTNGNLGIGSTNPTSKLWVNGDGYFTGVVTATKFFGTIDASYASAQNVGFATTSMNVIGGIASVTSLTVSGFATFTSGLEVTDLLLIKPGQQSSNLFEILNDAQDVVVAVTTSGNLGIGTTTPSSKLWVNGNGYFTGVVTATKFYGDASALTGLTAGVSISTNTTNQTQYLTYVTGTGSTSGFGITTIGLVFNPSSGNLGISSATPTSKLTVQGDVLISGVTTSGITRISSSAVSPNDTKPVATLEAVGASTDYDIAIVPKGTGAVVASIPDGTSVGGNKRGTYAVDLQLSRNSATQVASGIYCVIGGGLNNTSAGTKTFVGGGEGNDTKTGWHGAIVGGLNNTLLATGGVCFIGGGNNNTTSNDYAAIVGGSSNTVNGQYSSVLGGQFSIANKNYSSVIGGYGANTRNTNGAVAFAGANTTFGTGSGVALQQARFAILSKETTDATLSILTADGSASYTNNVLQVVTKSAYLVKGSVIAYSNASDLARAWEFTAAIKNTSGTTTLVGTPIINDIAYDSGASGWNLSITADSGTSSLKVEVTGQSSTTIRWVTKMDSTEVAFQ
jgi:hypothetical protein